MIQSIVHDISRPPEDAWWEIYLITAFATYRVLGTNKWSLQRRNREIYLYVHTKNICNVHVHVIGGSSGGGGCKCKPVFIRIFKMNRISILDASTLKITNTFTYMISYWYRRDKLVIQTLRGVHVIRKYMWILENKSHFGARVAPSLIWLFSRTQYIFANFLAECIHN